MTVHRERKVSDTDGSFDNKNNTNSDNDNCKDDDIDDICCRGD